MTRIKYLENGIYTSLKSDLDDIKSNFQNSKNTASSLSCPSWFSLISYVNSLDSLISDYLEDLEDIVNKVKYADTEYEDVTNEMCNDVASLNKETIKLRERLVE